MDQDTADAISIIEKQMAEKDQKLASTGALVKIHDAMLNGLTSRVLKMEKAAEAFAAFTKG